MIGGRFPRRVSTVRAAAAAVAATGAATLLSLPFEERVSVASIYLLAVVVAAAIGGLSSGLAAALLAFLGLNFFFTPPRHTFRVERAEDFIALLVFLIVAMIVGALLARALEERGRAEQREQETRLLGYLSAKLLSGDAIDRVLTDFASSLLDPFGLARCEIRATLDDVEVGGVAERPGVTPGTGEVVPLIVTEAAFGTLTASRAEGTPPLSAEQHVLLEAVAKQAALALERAQMAERIRGAQLESETNQTRAALFSSVTHDLRTPLSSIKAGVTSLLDPSASHDSLQQRDLLTTILEETDRLNRLVGNLMDLSKIRAGAMIPAREPIAVDETVAAVVARLSPKLEGVRISLAIRPNLPDVLADPMQVDQVLTNLLENAIGHSPRGGEVRLSATRYRDMIQIRVADRGPGVPPAERERVFEAFYRGHPASGRPGSGLGLAIARAIVVEHGGRIWVEGAPGGGTVVVFELPLSIMDPDPHPTPASSESR
jgi:two-component system sensor histidine kinase KdpD